MTDREYTRRVLRRLHKPPWHGARRAYSSTAKLCLANAMECKHLLPASQCSLCLHLVEDLGDAAYERHDYVEVIQDREVQTYPQAEVEVGTVHPREIYPAQSALKVGRTRK